MPAALEPAVVQHETLGAHLDGGVRQRAEPAEVVLEVDGLPGVEGDRPGPPRMPGPGPQMLVEAPGQLVEPVAVRPDDPRARVRLAARQPDFAPEQRLPGAEQGHTGGGAFGEGAVVAAPRHVDSPDLARTEAEAGLAREMQQRRVGARTAPAVLPQMRTESELVPLRAAFARVSAGEVQEFGGVGGHGEGQQQTVQDVRALAGVAVGDGGALPYEPGGGQLDLQHELEPGVFVHGVDGELVRLGEVGRADGTDRADGEGGGEVGAVAVAGEARCTEPARRVLRQEGERHRKIEGVGHLPCGARGGQFGERGVVDVPEVVAPVEHPGQPAAGAVEDQTRTLGTEMEVATGVTGAHTGSSDRPASLFSFGVEVSTRQ